MNPVSIDEFEKIERYLWDHIVRKQSESGCYMAGNHGKGIDDESLLHIHLASDHSQADEKCESSDLQYVLSYARSYVIFDSRSKQVIDNRINVPVFKCGSCGHYHAVLPSIIIVPYCQYSLFFILSVLYSKEHSNMTVSEIAETYQISISTIYRWKERFAAYRRFYQMIRGQLHMNMFVSLLGCHADVVGRIYGACTRTLMQEGLGMNSS